MQPFLKESELLVLIHPTKHILLGMAIGNNSMRNWLQA